MEPLGNYLYIFFWRGVPYYNYTIPCPKALYYQHGFLYGLVWGFGGLRLPGGVPVRVWVGLRVPLRVSVRV